MEGPKDVEDMPDLWEIAVVEKPRSLTTEVRQSVPPIIGAAGDRAAWRFLEFFAANIRNKNTRAAYARAVRGFCDWLNERGLTDIRQVLPVIVAAYVEKLTDERSRPTVQAAPGRHPDAHGLPRHRRRPSV